MRKGDRGGFICQPLSQSLFFGFSLSVSLLHTQFSVMHTNNTYTQLGQTYNKSHIGDEEMRRWMDDDRPFIKHHHPWTTETHTGLAFTWFPLLMSWDQSFIVVILLKRHHAIVHLSASNKMWRMWIWTFRRKPNGFQMPIPGAEIKRRRRKWGEELRREKGVNKDIKVKQWLAKTDGMRKTKQRQQRERDNSKK